MYLLDLTSEKNFIICTDEFGLEYEGYVAIITCVLYGGKSTGTDYWLHIRFLINHVGFKSSHSDSNVWMREGIKEDGS